jgi:acetylserotonin N-methyltransferase
MTYAQTVIDLIEGFRRSKVAFTAASLGIYDRLEESPAGVHILAQSVRCDEQALEELLNACVALGLLERTGDCYRNLPIASRYLTRNSPDTLVGYILYSDRILYPLWARLEDAVREGTHRWEQVFGGKAGVFDSLFSTEESSRTFISGMHGMGRLSSPAVAAAVDLSRFRQLCDLGGGSGHLAIESCRRYPALRATVFDLPEVIAQAKRYIKEADLSARIGVQAGDFFTDPLPGADLFALGRIVHDWAEPKIVTLLKKIYDRLPDGGALLICERVLNPLKDGPLSSNLQSLNMLVMMEGRERTAAEYEVLVRQAGFQSFEVRTTGRTLDAMLAVKS